MKTAETKQVILEIKRLIPADWNYKEPSEEGEYKERFKRSIEEDKSAGVMAVRQMKRNTWEVIDGNHRLEALKELGWTHAPCEDFGKISKAKAVLIARRRNHNWFKDDTLKLAELLKEASQEISIESMSEYMPDTKEELENLRKLLDFDWSQFDKSKDSPEVIDEGLKKIDLKISEEAYSLWVKWIERCRKEYNVTGDDRCFELALTQALNSAGIDKKSKS